MIFRTKMFYRYTPSARRVIFYAAHEARHRGVTAISTEHILLGLARDRHADDCPFRKLHEQKESIAANLHLAWLPGDAFVGSRIGKNNAPPLSERSKRVLAYAAEEMKRTKQFWLDTEFLQVGLIRGGGPAADTLIASSYSLEETQRLGEEGRQKTPPRKPSLQERAAIYPWPVWLIVSAIITFVVLNLVSLARAR